MHLASRGNIIKLEKAMSGQVNTIMFNRRFYLLSIALSLCVLLETVSFTYMQENGARFYYSSSVLYFLTGLAVSLLPLIATSGESRLIKGFGSISKYLPFLFGIFFLAILGYHIWLLKPLYKLFPIDKRWEDMFPALQVACQRLLAGKTVYGPTPEVWPRSILQYMPMMWMPYLPAEYFSFDYRWTTLTLQFLGLGAAFTPLFDRRKALPLIPSLIAAAALFLFINFFLIKNHNYWLLTEEGVVTGFYVLLGFALLRGNYWFIGIAMMTCTLSRYSLVFWIPVYFAYVFLMRPRSDFWKLALSYGISMSVFFFFPFFIKDPAYFFRIPATYTRFIPGFWVENHIDAHQYYNVGLFKFFTSRTCLTMNVWAAVTSFLAPLILILAVKAFRNRIPVNEKYLGYATLKIALVFFFSFMAMPFQYVFVPATLMSYAVLFYFISGEEAKTTAKP
jgi:hypothetical protein